MPNDHSCEIRSIFLIMTDRIKKMIMDRAASGIYNYRAELLWFETDEMRIKKLFFEIDDIYIRFSRYVSLRKQTKTLWALSLTI